MEHLLPSVFEIQNASKLTGSSNPAAAFQIVNQDGTTIAALLVQISKDGEMAHDGMSVYPMGADINGCAVVFPSPPQYAHEDGRDLIVANHILDAMAATKEYGRRVACTVRNSNLAQSFETSASNIIFIAENTMDDRGMPDSIGIYSCWAAKVRHNREQRWSQVKSFEFAASYYDYMMGKLHASV